MSQVNYNMIGLMSGTSGDGLDLAYCRYELQEQWTFEIVKAQTIPFPEELGERLADSHLLSALDLALLDVDFGKWMGLRVKDFCMENHLTPYAVCSHGHTVFHQPQKRISVQIGNGWALHQASGLKVINDFRMLDVQNGGQGAPLVTIGDRLLFPQMDFCINLGGIANISMEYQGKRIAFDCSPFNILMNPLAQKLGREYDDRGQWAKAGKLNPSLFSQLNELPYYKNDKAKSLGREDMEDVFTPLIQSAGSDEKDLLHTLIEHYAFQISKIILQYKSTDSPKVLLTGGGAYNEYFVERLDHFLGGSWKKHPTSKKLIEFKEALVFGFLGVLRLRGEVNCLASVTGANTDTSGGVIYE